MPLLNVTVNDDILATLKNKPAQKKALLYLAKIKEASTKDLANEKISLPTLKALADLDYIKLEKKPWYIRYRYYLIGGDIVCRLPDLCDYFVFRSQKTTDRCRKYTDCRSERV